MIEVVVIRHSKERLAKCSLRHLEGREGFRFTKAKEGFRFDASGFTLLSVDGPELTAADNGRPLLLLDSTWRLLPKLEACLDGESVKRRLPRGLKTAYPRISKISEDPEGGLASVEAVYAALRILGEENVGLLDGYFWRDAFLAANGWKADST